MLKLEATHQGARIKAEHIEGEAIDRAHRIVALWATDLRRELAGEHVDVSTTADGFMLTVETKRGDDAVLRIWSVLAALPHQLRGAGVKWGGPGLVLLCFALAQYARISAWAIA